MAAFLKGSLVLLAVLGVFIAFKIPHLFYPYYWDECWPYATAIKAMCDNGLSFMPDAIEANLSRGHPLFFQVIAAGWMKIFGASHLAMHSFFFITFVASWFWMLHVICHKALFVHAFQRRFLALTGCFVLVFVCFSSFNFLTYRYFLMAIIPLLFAVAALLDVFIDQIYKPLFAVTLLVFSVISYYSFTFNKVNFGDTDLGAFDAMTVQQDVVNYIEDNVPLNTPIGTAGYLAQQHLSLPSTGFLKNGSRYNNVKWEIDANTQIAVFDNIEPDYRYNSIKSDTAYYQLKRFEKGMVWAEIYKRK